MLPPEGWHLEAELHSPAPNTDVSWAGLRRWPARMTGVPGKLDGWNGRQQPTTCLAVEWL